MKPCVIAHRGASAEAPENSMPAFVLALELGAGALELDVRRSADGALVVIHDPTLDRTSDRGGEVARLTLAGIRQADLGTAGDPAVPRWPSGAAVPTLDEVFERFPGLEITVDVKDASAAPDVVRLIEAFDRVRETILYVEEGTDSEAFRGYAGRRATSVAQALRLATDPGWLSSAPGREIPEVLHTPLRARGIDLVDPDRVRRLRTAGRSVQVWTVDDAATMRRLADCGVDGIITNDVRLAADVLGSERRREEAD